MNLIGVILFSYIWRIFNIENQNFIRLGIWIWDAFSYDNINNDQLLSMATKTWRITKFESLHYVCANDTGTV